MLLLIYIQDIQIRSSGITMYLNTTESTKNVTIK